MLERVPDSPLALARGPPALAKLSCELRRDLDARFDAEADAIVFRRLGGRERWLDVMKECPPS